MIADWSQPVFESLAQLVAARTGLVTSRTPEDFERASRRAMHKLALRDLAEFAGRLAGGEGWDELLDEVTVGETYFFRNPEHFELVSDTILPAILNDRKDDATLRVWSAGCASGEEPYSLAILLDQAGLLARASVYGTDICALALAKARSGRYREWAFRQIDASLTARYFRGDRSERTLHSAIRAAVTFRQLNLADDVYPARSTDTCEMDLIFCRNVLIYLSTEAIAHVGRKLFAALAPGGWLVTGPSDPLLSHAADYEVITTPRAICYRRPHARFRAFRTPLLRTPERAELLALPKLAPANPRSFAAVEAPGRHALAHAAFTRADYPQVIQLARMHPDDHTLSVLWVRASWNHADGLLAQRVCAEAIARHALSAELHYLHAVALLDCRRLTEALAAVNKAIYLDRTLSVAHFALGSILERLHDRDGARRAYRNARSCANAQAPEQLLPLGDGIVAAGMLAATTHALSALEKRGHG
jgi:chemotaxis protein methyltransferase CheR